jgi:hypothetical protein
MAEENAIRLSEVLSALSYVLDTVEGQPQGHVLRSCFIGMTIANGLHLSTEERSALFYALLLKDAGCSSNASRLSSLFDTDDFDAKRRFKTVDWSRTGAASPSSDSGSRAPSARRAQSGPRRAR